MTIEKTLQVSMELWGAILCIIFMVLNFLWQEGKTRQGKFLQALILQVMLVLISDSAAIFYRGRLTTAAFWAVRISNYLVFALNYTLAYTTLLYLEEILRERKMNLLLKHVMMSICLLAIVLLTISQFTGLLYTIGADNLYVRTDGYWMIVVTSIAVLLILLYSTIHYAGAISYYQYRSLLVFLVLTIAATLVQFAYYGFSFIYIAMTIGMTNLFFAYAKEWSVAAQEKETMLLKQELELARKDAELAGIRAELSEKQTQIIMSQIKPHFLYNALSAMSILCIKDPVKAKDTIDNFADFVRTSLDNLNGSRMVPFNEELQHTNAYLAIESVRFGDDLTVVYDISCSDFMVPSLCVQPIVENAVRHGACKNEDGGTVTIRAMAADSGFRIVIADDGPGFDPLVKPSDGRSHVGLENVKQRLRSMADGTLTVSSAPGAGTEITIDLPETCAI